MRNLLNTWLEKRAESVESQRRRAVDIIRPYTGWAAGLTLGLGTPLGAWLGRRKAMQEGISPGIADQTGARLMNQMWLPSWAAFGPGALLYKAGLKIPFTGLSHYAFTSGMPSDDKESTGGKDQMPVLKHIIASGLGTTVDKIPDDFDIDRADPKALADIINDLDQQYTKLPKKLGTPATLNEWLKSRA